MFLLRMSQAELCIYRFMQLLSKSLLSLYHS
ncbi:MAG: hypothetical protein ACI88A_003346, partial [Paraglaciecola sp.]